MTSPAVTRSSRPIIGVVLALAAALAAPGCTSDDPGLLGGACRMEPQVVAVDGVTIQVPTLECATRMCLGVSEETLATKPVDGTCTDLCTGDAECAAIEGPDCLNGYVCAIPTVTGPFCCKSICVCRDDLARLPAGQPDPVACDAVDPTNTCQNLPGRVDEGGDW